MDFLKSAVASAIAKGSSFPYSFGDRVDEGESIWTLHNGTKREDNSPCSIFTFDINANKSRLPLAKNAMRKLRTLRHPGVMKVLDTIETDTNIYIVTERVAPLTWPVKRKSLSEETAKWGLYTVASTLKFINEDASSVHGAVRVGSIYTSESGEWKLGGFDVLSSMKEDDAIIYTYGSLVPDSARYSPPEVSKSGWDTIKRNPLSAVDAFNFGNLIFEVFNGSYRADQAGLTTNVPPSMLQSYQRLTNPNPKLRLSTGHFLDQGRKSGGFFETPLIRLTQDIESLGLKNEAERDAFVSELDNLSDDFPEEFFKMKVLPELLKSVEFGGGGPKVFGAIMKIGTKLTEEEFSTKLTPVIVRLFGNPDRALRVSLLDNLPLMIDNLPQKIVNNKIFPQMLTGFTDVAPVVREQTVKAVLTVVPKLSDRTTNGELLRYLAKTANDEQPGIRTNTTICLGKIAKNLSASTRSKILIAAFCRSLRDPFVHARNASLLALGATLEIFSEEDCACRILPAICPALIDNEKLIRDQATKTLDLYLQRIQKHSSTMAETALPPPNAAAAKDAPARIGTSNDTSWAGWAISSFTNKAAAAKGEIQPTANGSQAAAGGDTLRPSSVPLQNRTSQSAPKVPTETLQPGTLTPGSGRPSSEQPSIEAEAEADDVLEAWGTMDDDDDTFFDATPNSTTNNNNNSNGGFNTAPATTVSTPAIPYDDGGEPDFAGWLEAQSKAKIKPKKPLPKGLGKSTSPAPKNPPRPKSNLRSSSVATTSKAKTPAKTIDTKPKDEDEDDGWGDAWD
ncbi:hypothetical protein FQN54_002083 [Arachnomyces sp. PD_36]|nr:hypothetical protein FQN54_002083 [Arachnomyces sp. PD_36]